jgi:hypothetical protein
MGDNFKFYHDLYWEAERSGCERTMDCCLMMMWFYRNEY